MKHSRVILVASEEMATCESIRQLLKDDALILQTEAFGAAQEQVVTHQPDLLVVDASVLKGRLDLGLRQLRQLAGDAPMILLVLIDEPWIRDLAKSLKVEVLLKPFDGPLFQGLCANLLEQGRLQRENRELRGGWLQPEAPGGRMTLTQLRMQDRSRDLDRPSNLFPQPLTPFSVSQGLYLLVPRLNLFLKALANFQDVRKLSERTVEGVTELFGLPFCCLMILDETEMHYRVVASHGLDETLLRALKLGMDSPLVQWLLRNNQCLSQDDCRTARTGPAGYSILRQMEILRTEWVLPLWNKGRLLGLLGMSRKATGRSFSDEEMDLLIMLASYVGVALENALFYRTLSHQSSFNESVLYHLGSGVLAIDAQGRISCINENGQKILGLPAAQMAGREVEAAGSVVADILHRTLEENRSFSRHEFYYPYTRKLIGGGTTVLRDSDGRRVGAVMVFTDLSDIRPSENVPEEDRTIEELVNLTAWLAHEIKNPLVAIKTFTQLLPEHYKDQEFRERFNTIVLGEVNRLDSVVDSVVEFGRREELQRRPADIHPVLENVLQDIQAELNERKIQIEKDYSVEGRMVAIDREQIRLALRNLFLGAIGGASEGRLWLKTTIRTGIESGGGESSDYLEILLCAHPECTPRKELRRIFLPYLASEERESKLSLGIARKIIRQHHGWMEVADDANPTTDFVVLLPMIQN